MEEIQVSDPAARREESVAQVADQNGHSVNEVEPRVIVHGEPLGIRGIIGRNGTSVAALERGPFEVDVLWPKVLDGKADICSIDEGSAALLTGFVQALRPKVVLETGTHRGRSTRAIVDGLEANNQGHLWTMDMDDYGLLTEGAIPPELHHRVTQVVGKSPGILVESPLVELAEIDLAFIDGDHTRDTLLAELQFVEDHRAKECVVLVDNARDAMWPDVMDIMAQLPYPHISLPTMCGLEVIWMMTPTTKEDN